MSAKAEDGRGISVSFVNRDHATGAVEASAQARVMLCCTPSRFFDILTAEEKLEVEVGYATDQPQLHAIVRVAHGELSGKAEVRGQTCMDDICSSEMVTIAGLVRTCDLFDNCFEKEEKFFLSINLTSDVPSGTNGSVTVLIANKLDAAMHIHSQNDTLEGKMKLAPLWEITVPEVLRVFFASVSASGELLRLEGDHTREGEDGMDVFQRVAVAVHSPGQASNLTAAYALALADGLNVTLDIASRECGGDASCEFSIPSNWELAFAAGLKSPGGAQHPGLWTVRLWTDASPHCLQPGLQWRDYSGSCCYEEKTFYEDGFVEQYCRYEFPGTRGSCDEDTEWEEHEADGMVRFKNRWSDSCPTQSFSHCMHAGYHDGVCSPDELHNCHDSVMCQHYGGAWNCEDHGCWCDTCVQSACREFGAFDSDCCGLDFTVSCADGYSMFLSANNGCIWNAGTCCTENTPTPAARRTRMLVRGEHPDPMHHGRCDD
jgi:hypothetical protein